MIKDILYIYCILKCGSNLYSEMKLSPLHTYRHSENLQDFLIQAGQADKIVKASLNPCGSFFYSFSQVISTPSGNISIVTQIFVYIIYFEMFLFSGLCGKTLDFLGVIFKNIVIPGLPLTATISKRVLIMTNLPQHQTHELRAIAMIRQKHVRNRLLLQK